MFYYLVEPIGFEPPTIGLWARPKYQKLYHDVGASFIPTVPPSVTRLRLGKWLRKLIGSIMGKLPLWSQT